MIKLLSEGEVRLGLMFEGTIREFFSLLCTGVTRSLEAFGQVHRVSGSILALLHVS